jgi:Rieske Fe-S protein
LGDRLKAPSRGSLEDIAPGEGKLLELGGKRRAVYRDETGSLSILDPVCRRLGCVVAWNTAEKSWDCPCHGSRFDTTGAVMDGPALTGLKAV